MDEYAASKEYILLITVSVPIYSLKEKEQILVFIIVVWLIVPFP